jgi:1,4-dihydroxy-2-naphthoate octaprenyltransferase
MTLKEKVRDWLQVFRAQTAPATVIMVLTSYLLGGGNLFTVEGLSLGILALLFHWFTFGHNSLMDTVAGHDLRDKQKAHHALVRGAISLESAHKVIHTGLFILTLIAIWLALKGDGNPSLALAWFAIFITAGHAYNDGLSKTTIWSFAPITICFTAFSLYGFYISATEN